MIAVLIREDSAKQPYVAEVCPYISMTLLNRLIDLGWFCFLNDFIYYIILKKHLFTGTTLPRNFLHLQPLEKLSQLAENDGFSPHGFRCPVLAFSQPCLWVLAKALLQKLGATGVMMVIEMH